MFFIRAISFSEFLTFLWVLSISVMGVEAKETSLKEVRGFLNLTPSYINKIKVVDKPVLYDNGILFTYFGSEDDTVYISGDFNEWQENILMTRNKNNVFYYFLTMALPKGKYGYRFSVNGFWINDQEQPFYTIDIHNQRVSCFQLPREIVFTVPYNPEPLANGKHRFYLQDRGYRQVSLISDVNYWEPGALPMQLKNGYWYVDYYWGDRKLLYSFWVDGEKTLDPLNLKFITTGFNFSVNYYIPNSSRN